MAEIIGTANKERKLGEFIPHGAYPKQKKQRYAMNKQLKCFSKRMYEKVPQKQNFV